GEEYALGPQAKRSCGRGFACKRRPDLVEQIFFQPKLVARKYNFEYQKLKQPRKQNPKSKARNPKQTAAK
ncbi:MAG TPA: hypothetical protein VNT99_00375, partial [Methylomirabilota bacterium]|nr:hypothetical protein [Methylomirabilota bacterium]